MFCLCSGTSQKIKAHLTSLLNLLTRELHCSSPIFTCYFAVAQAPVIHAQPQSNKGPTQGHSKSSHHWG